MCQQAALPNLNGQANRQPINRLAGLVTPGTNGTNHGLGQSASVPELTTHGTGHTAQTPAPVPAPLNPSADGKPAAQEGRGAGGKFTKGNKLGRGNPFTRQLGQLRREFLAVATPDKIRALADKLYRRAMGGDVPSAKIFLAYAVGRPVDAIDPDSLDADEVRRLLDVPKPVDLSVEMMERLDPETLAALARTVIGKATDVENPQQLTAAFMNAMQACKVREAKRQAALLGGIAGCVGDLDAITRELDRQEAEAKGKR